MPLDPRTHLATSPLKASDKAWAYFYKNMAASLSMLTLTVGGLLLLSYMWGIGFMPDIKLQDMTSVLYAMALIGIVFLLSVASLMACPGLLLAWGRLVYKGGWH